MVDRQQSPSTESKPVERSWISEPRRRGELRVIALFCAVNLAVPLFVAELFPFSRFWLFADAPQQYAVYEIRSDQGQRIAPWQMGLQRNYNGAQPYESYGRRLLPSIDRFGEVATEEDVRAQVRAALVAYPALSGVLVRQTVIGAINGDNIGIVETKLWRIQNVEGR